METKASDVYRIAICDDEPLLAQRNEALTREILTEDGLVEGRDFDTINRLAVELAKKIKSAIAE